MFMSRIAFDGEGRIRPAAVVLAGMVLSVVAFALDTLVATAAPALLGAAGEASAFGTGKVFLASVPAVLGNTLGFYMSYRRPDPRAELKFLAPAAGFFVAFMSIPAWGLISGGTLTSFAVGAVLNIVPVAMAVPALLALRPAAAAERPPVPAQKLRVEASAR